MNKKQLRKKAMENRKNIPEDIRNSIENILCMNLLHTDLWKQSDVIGVTIATENEWDTTLLIETAWKEHKTICVPRTIREENKLIFYRLDDFSQLKRSSYNILEPAENGQEIEKNAIDLLIVPGLLFDKNGYRIGYGGGYYDRFLMDFQNKTVSLASEKQLVDHLPAEAHDIPVQYLVTENGLLKT